VAIRASGDRSVAAQTVSGVAVTGDSSYVVISGAAQDVLAMPQEVQAAPTTNNLPRVYARPFVGRNAELHEIAEAFKRDSSNFVAVYQLRGNAGTGKTTLAIQYAEAHTDRYSLIWLIHARNAENVQTGLAELAAALHPANRQLTISDAAEWAFEWLRLNQSWLLILDDVADVRDIESLLAIPSQGHILITTRVTTHRTGGEAHWLYVDALEPAASVELITRVTGKNDDAGAALALSNELARNPLALWVASNYIHQNNIAIRDYVGRLETARQELRVTKGNLNSASVITATQVAVSHIGQQNPLAAQLLFVASFFAPNQIPRGLLLPAAPDRQAFDEALALLLSHGLIRMEADAVSIHPLIQSSVLDILLIQESRYNIGLDEATVLLEKALPGSVAYSTWESWRLLISHAESVARRYGEDAPSAVGDIFAAAAAYRFTQGQYDEALSNAQIALRITEAQVGSDNLDTAVALSNMATIMRALGRLRETLPLQDRALRIVETTLGPDHPEVGVRLASLAATLSDLGRVREALPLQERALAITETALGPSHPRVATALSNLAATSSNLGRINEALQLQEKALNVAEASLGPEHPDLGTLLNNLASSLKTLGRVSEAVPLQHRALAITEVALGPDHPHVATRLNNLASSLRALGRPADALPLQQRALAITEAALGPDHPDVAIRLGNLAATYSDLGRHADALPLQQRALAITEAALGPDHPGVAVQLGNLAATYRDLGRHADALPLQQRALAITEAALGPDHPGVAVQLGNLAATYRDLGRHADALPLQQRALAITETNLGEHNLDVVIGLANLADTYSALGRDEDALTLARRGRRVMTELNERSNARPPEHEHEQSSKKPEGREPKGSAEAHQ
jgi:tetratricopeptide (TPR) repeat protein